MTDPVFLKQTAGLTVREIVSITGAEASSDAQLDLRIRDVAPLDRAGPSDLTFIDSPRYLEQLQATRAAVCLAGDRFAAKVPERIVTLKVRAPYRALVAVARALFPQALRPSRFITAQNTVAETAVVDKHARLEENVTIEAGAVIGPGAEIGSGTTVAPTAVIGPEVRIGRDCSIGPGASISNALIGDNVIIHAGARIGQDGFGYLPGMKGHEKVPQTGRVIVQDRVEIGANTTIDRGAMRDTVIGEGTKIDNLVQIGHNVTIGRNCIVVSQTGISGSATLGEFVMLGGQVGIVDHAVIGDGAQIAARGGVISDVPAGAKLSGFPAVPAWEWLRGAAMLRKLAKTRAGTGEKDGIE